MKSILFVVDLGHFKAYSIERTELGTPRVELIESYDTLDAHGKFSEKFSDKPGRFGMGGERSTLKGYGEAHNLETEKQKRLLKSVADEIVRLVQSEDCGRWYLAAPKKINSRLVELIDEETRRTLRKNIPVDLTKADKSELLERLGI